jgi:hypothetical protein
LPTGILAEVNQSLLTVRRIWFWKVEGVIKGFKMGKTVSSTPDAVPIDAFPEAD